MSAWVEPVVLRERGVRLDPLAHAHEIGLREATLEGALWTIRVTSVPEPGQTRAYVDAALAACERGDRMPFAVVDEASGQMLGSTSYHGILPAVKRLEIGRTWYARRVQHTYVNTVCKLLLMQHAFDTLGARIVGWRTDNFNFASQRAIERLGTGKDGVLRGQALRRDGTIRNTVMYSLSACDWPEARAQLLERLRHHDAAALAAPGGAAC